MSTFLAYTPPAAGHLFPLIPGLLELTARGHTVHLRTAPDLVETARSAGLTAGPIDPRILDVAVSGNSAHGSAAGRHRNGIGGLLARGPLELEDLDRAIAQTHPDALLIDTNTYGAAVAAERSGLPWATTLPSLLPLPGAGIPAYGLGMAPMRSPLGAVRDRLLWKLVERLFARAMLPRLNDLRAGAGLSALRSPLDHVLGPDRLMVLTGDPLEYPRADLPSHVRFVGAQLWDPPTARHEWLTSDGDPWVLVTCSTDYQGDELLARTAVEALRDEPVRVVLTLADAYETADVHAAGNVRVERFVSHSSVLQHAVAVVCPAGMGIVQKSIAAGVPVVGVPFGRDQPEVARRLTEARAGVALPAKRLTPARLRAAVRQAIELAPSTARAAERIRRSGGAGTFADVAEELVSIRSRQAA